METFDVDKIIADDPDPSFMKKCMDLAKAEEQDNIEIGIPNRLDATVYYKDPDGNLKPAEGILDLDKNSIEPV